MILAFPLYDALAVDVAQDQARHQPRHGLTRLGGQYLPMRGGTHVPEKLVQDAKCRESDMRRCRHMPVRAGGPVEHPGRTSRLSHGHEPAAQPRDAKDKEARGHHRPRGCSVVKLYNEQRPHGSIGN